MWPVKDKVKQTMGIKERAFCPTLVDKGSDARSLFLAGKVSSISHKTSQLEEKSYQNMSGRSCFTAYHCLQIHVKQRVLKNKEIGSEAFQFTFLSKYYELLAH